MLVQISEEIGGAAIEPASGPAQTMTFKRKRLVIKKLGEIGLGGRLDGILDVKGNEISIGKDTGFFGGRQKSPARVVRSSRLPSARARCFRGVQAIVPSLSFASQATTNQIVQ